MALIVEPNGGNPAFLRLENHKLNGVCVHSDFQKDGLMERDCIINREKQLKDMLRENVGNGDQEIGERGAGRKRGRIWGRGLLPNSFIKTALQRRVSGREGQRMELRMVSGSFGGGWEALLHDSIHSDPPPSERWVSVKPNIV